MPYKISHRQKDMLVSIRDSGDPLAYVDSTPPWEAKSIADGSRITRESLVRNKLAEYIPKLGWRITKEGRKAVRAYIKAQRTPSRRSS